MGWMTGVQFQAGIFSLS